MTKTEAVNKMIAWARTQIGYVEGGDNYNKYAADPQMTKWLGWNAQNQPWCDIFADYCFLAAFGLENAAKMTYQPIGNGSALCRASAQYYKDHTAWTTNEPEPGDQIYFYYGGAINHTGVVESVTPSTVTTIEGNSSDRVQRCTYARSNGVIAGYGRPRWSVVAESSPDDPIPPEPAPIEPSDEIKVGNVVKFVGNTHYASSDANRGYGCNPGLATVTILAPGAPHPVHLVAVNGEGSTVWGWVNESDIELKKPEPEPTPDPTPAPTPTPGVSGLPELKSGSTGGHVTVLQVLLGVRGYACTVTGTVDNGTVEKLKEYQAKAGLEADGICGPATWAALLEVSV